MRSYLMLILVFGASICAARAEQSPTEAYMQLHAKELQANSYEDLLPLRSKSSIAEDKTTSAEDKKMLFPLLKELTPKVVHVNKETIDGNKAILEIDTPKQGPNLMGMVDTITGTVTLEKEDGNWLLFKEKWNSKSESAPTPEPSDMPKK